MNLGAVRQARDLKVTQAIGRQSPYVVLKLGEQMWTSNVHHGALPKLRWAAAPVSVPCAHDAAAICSVSWPCCTRAHVDIANLPAHRCGTKDGGTLMCHSAVYSTTVVESEATTTRQCRWPHKRIYQRGPALHAPL